MPLPILKGIESGKMPLTPDIRLRFERLFGSAPIMDEAGQGGPVLDSPAMGSDRADDGKVPQAPAAETTSAVEIVRRR